ncbi:anthranilate synthase component I family protein [Acinetobacter sp. MD2(2019)]|uniref:anthranilate synthase component I family protein n=1 Tax=Acinetobacter sp. MD2(2019) TaxID=2605273 RepID=UPI002D1E588C|nr:anthranilate synthase component I family protein [Acinetobacter sp. MD2(2019)]MEB3754555.1 anthranilate synthase component I family protein [Acinetobacter sp. MD2(2019)]
MSCTFTFTQELPQLKHFSAADILQRLSTLDGLIYLHDHGQAVIGFFPQQYQITQHDTQQFIRQSDLSYRASSTAELWQDWIQCDAATAPKTNPQTQFQGGWMGFIGYDYAAKQNVHAPQQQQPAVYLGKYLSFLKYAQNTWTFYSLEENAADIYDKLITYLEKSPNQNTFQITIPCTARWSKTEYVAAFNRVIDYIRAGDCYQINLTQQFMGQAQGALVETAEQFWQLTHAPYAGYLRVADFELLSCSPELFIEFKNNQQIVTRPIKGTMPRHSNPIQDELSKQTLQSSLKDQAENVMIVDLLRNDLSIFAEIGSVKTNQLFEIESFEQVHHMVSEVEATLKADVQPMQMLLQALPGGSITGAPKIRAMQIIAELEQQARGAYCGSLGYFNLNGTGRWNILIRSIQKYQQDISMWAGGGITIASNAEAEYQECFDKISAMLNLLNTWHKEA